MPDVLEGAEKQVYTLWCVIENKEKIVAGIATRIIKYPRRKAFAIEFVGGHKMKNWIDDVLQKMDEIATFNGCSHIEGYGRAAWLKYLDKRGFKEAFRTFEKEINNG